MATTFAFPRHGLQRGGTLTYVRGGWAFSGFSGWGQEAVGQGTTPAGVAVVPQDDYGAALRRQAAELATKGVTDLVTGSPNAGAIAMRSAAQLEFEAAKQRSWRAAGMSAPPGIQRAQGLGQGLARVREAWARATPGQKAAVGVGGGLGAAWLLGLL